MKLMHVTQHKPVVTSIIILWANHYVIMMRQTADHVLGGSVAEWSARRTRYLAVPGSSPALATRWICARSSRVQILGHACK